MIARDFDIQRVWCTPEKAYPPLIVDADAVLARPFSLQSLESVARRRQQVVETIGFIEVNEFASCRSLNAGRKLSRWSAAEDHLGFGIRERLDHGQV